MGRRTIYETDDEKRRAHNDQLKKYYDSHKFYCEICDKLLSLSSKKYHLKSTAHYRRGQLYEKSTSKENGKGAGIDHFSILHPRNSERRANKNEYKDKIFLDKNKSFPVEYKNDNDTAVLSREG